MADEVPLSWVIVAYHRPAALDRLLTGVRGGAALDVVVVNVQCDAEVAAVAARHGARTVEIDANPGFAHCVNRGVDAATHPIVAFGNDDLQTTWADLQQLAARVSDGGCDAAVPRILDGDGRAELTIAPLVSPRSLLLEWALLPDQPVSWLARLPVEKWRTPVAPEPVPAATAALVVVRRALLLEEPVPEAYFLYWEEQEWFWRLAQRGAATWYIPGAVVHHEGGRVDVRPDKSVLMARNSVRCVRRTQGRLAAALAWPVVVAWNLRLLVLDGLRSLTGRNGPSRVPARAAGLRAAAAAWREVR